MQHKVRVTRQIYTYGWEEYLSNVGGFLGLLLGASILGTVTWVQRRSEEKIFRRIAEMHKECTEMRF